MSKADELKSKNENLFQRNTILLNENERLQKEVEYQTNDCKKWQEMYKNRCEEYQKLEKELSENKVADNEIVNGLCNQIQDLQKENAEQKSGCGMCYSRDKEKLAQAKEIIKKCVHIIKHSGTALEWNDVIGQAEQFLNGENIILEDAQAGNSPFDADEVFNKEMKAYPEEKVKKEIEK